MSVEGITSTSFMLQFIEDVDTGFIVIFIN